MQDFYNKNRQLIIGVLVGIVSVYLVSSLVIEKRLHEMKVSLDDKILEQEIYLKELFTVTGRGGVNENTMSVIRDCVPEKRKQFDSLLSALDSGLPIRDLRVLNNLFGECGYVFANQRAHMVGQIQQGVFLLTELETQKKLLQDSTSEDVSFSKWQELEGEEIKLKDLFFSLVDVQGRIIEALLAGESTNSSSITTLREEAGKIQSDMSETTKITSVLRSELISS